MSLSGWRILRLRSGSVNFPSFVQMLNSWQSVSAGPSRSISITSIDRLSVEGGGSDGPREPIEESAAQDKEFPEAVGDKRLWRRWIEERLAHSKAGGEEKFPGSSGSSIFADDVPNSSLSADDVGGTSSPFGGTLSVEKDDLVVSEERSSSTRSFMKSTCARSEPTEDDVIAPHITESVKEFSGEYKGSTDLHTLSNEIPVTFTGTSGYANFGGNRNQLQRDSSRLSFIPDTEPSSRSTTKPSSLFHENTKRSSPHSAARPKASKASPQSSMNMELSKVEALDDFEYRVLGSGSDMDDTRDDDFLRELDEIGRSARGIRDFEDGEEESGADEDEDWDDEKAQVLTDLALSNLEEFDLEDEERPYRLRDDRLFFPGQTYDPEDLDLSKPVTELEKPTTRTRKNYSSKEVCQIADFRNPRYLSNFIRESSRILPRRHHQVSSKAQRRIAREIKTARILGLMPFTSMGDPPFRFMRSRSDEDAYPASEDD